MTPQAAQRIGAYCLAEFVRLGGRPLAEFRELLLSCESIAASDGHGDAAAAQAWIDRTRRQVLAWKASNAAAWQHLAASLPVLAGPIADLGRSDLAKIDSMVSLLGRERQKLVDGAAAFDSLMKEILE